MRYDSSEVEPRPRSGPFKRHIRRDEDNMRCKIAESELGPQSTGQKVGWRLTHPAPGTMRESVRESGIRKILNIAHE